MRSRIIYITFIIVISVAVALLISLQPLMASPGVYYVDAINGNDTTGDGSQAKPWRTISWALSQVTSGDTVMVLTGTYNVQLGESFPISLPSGVKLVGAGRDATIIAGESGKAVLYIGTSTSSILSDTVVSNLTLQGGSAGLEIYATNKVTVTPTITNLRIRWNRNGIRMTTSNTYEYGATVAPVISGTEIISNTEAGIYIRSYGYFSASSIAPLIQGCVVQENGSDGVSIEASAVSANGTSATPRIIATRVSRNGGHGIFATGTYQGWAQPQIERSWITDNKGYGFYWKNGINGGNLKSGITNTVIARNQGGGVYLDTSSSSSSSIRIVNSTIADNANYGIHWVWSDRISVSVLNTILWNLAADDLYSTGTPWTTAQVQYCDIEDGDFQGAYGNFSADPLLSEDYHLSSCSPAMNAGTNTGAPSNDIDGDPRPQGSKVDVGADEYEAPCWLQVSKTASLPQARLGDILTYTITLTNTSGTQLSVLVTDVLPSDLEFGSAWASQGTPIHASGTVTWTGTVDSGATLTIGLQSRVRRANTTIINSALADAGLGGLYRSGVCKTVVEPERAFLPLVLRRYCSGPFIDDFSNPASGWPIADTPYWSFNYWNGEYRMYAKQAEVFGAVTRGDRMEGNVIMEVDVRRASSATGSMGIIYGLSDDWSTFYTFEIYPDTQEYAVFYYANGNWSVFSHGTSTAIRPGQNANRLRLVKSYGMQLYVNGIYITSSGPYYDGYSYRVGLVAVSDAAGFDARFDNYKFVPDGCPENPSGLALQGTFTTLLEGRRDFLWSNEQPGERGR